MILSDKALRQDERACYKLRELYRTYGYIQYKVSKFEEYDLYAKNKSFLVSDNLLTFTDTNGKLMALKPDVTLSIIKNVVSNEKSSYKVYYDEKVYRTTSSGDGFREIMQTGLESIGNIDSFSQSEVIMLAMKSLENISEEYILDVSNMRFLEGLFESASISFDMIPEFLELIESKNIPALKTLCEKMQIEKHEAERIIKISSIYLPIEKALEEIKPLISGEKMQGAYEELEALYKNLANYGLTSNLYLDFSIVNDMNYYDGIIFKGYINGIFDSVLSGGRYDRLMEKFGKRTNAIGFAVYLDRLERYAGDSESYDFDVLLVYDAKTDASLVIEAVEKIKSEKKTVRAVNCVDNGVTYKELVYLNGEGADSLEKND